LKTHSIKLKKYCCAGFSVMQTVVVKKMLWHVIILKVLWHFIFYHFDCITLVEYHIKCTDYAPYHDGLFACIHDFYQGLSICAIVLWCPNKLEVASRIYYSTV